jgi:branched-subunit amino acid transport protein
MTWLSIIVAGILTYLTRMTMVALVSRDMLGDKIKAVLAYVPSAVFPAIIFPPTWKQLQTGTRENREEETKG